MFFNWVIRLVTEYWPLFLRGAGYTVVIAITGTIAGFVIGLFVSVVRCIPVDRDDPLVKKVLLKGVQMVLTAYVEFFRATPMMVQAVLLYYGSLQYFGIDFDPTTAGIIVVSINTGAYMAEIIRGGIISVDLGQTEGAQSIGMTHWQTMTTVVLPQAVRNILPALGNEFIINIKDSSVLSVISVGELFFQAKSAAGTYYKFFESFAIACVIYFILNHIITKILAAVEKKMAGAENFTIKGSQNMSADEMKTLHGNTNRGAK